MVGDSFAVLLSGLGTETREIYVSSFLVVPLQRSQAHKS